MRLYLLDLGHLDIDSNKVVWGSIQASVSEPHKPCAFRSIPMIAALIITDDGEKILYDTGSNFEAMNGYWPKNVTERSPFYYTKEQHIEHQLQLCSCSVKDIDTVIISHMHIDHIGNLGLFTHANAYVNKTEFEWALYMAHAYADPLKMPGDYLIAMKEEINTPMKEYICVEGDTVIRPGIELLLLPGHTPGLMGVKLDLPRTGSVILTSDACYTRENYGPPVKYSAVPGDTVAYRNSIEKLHRLENEHHAMMIFGHDMEQFMSLKRAPEYYE